MRKQVFLCPSDCFISLPPSISDSRPKSAVNQLQEGLPVYPFPLTRSVKQDHQMSALHWPRDSRDSCLCSLGLNSLIFKGGGVIRNLTSLGPLQWEYFCMLLSMFCFWALYLFLLMSDYDLKNFSAFSTVSSFSCVETTLPGVACFFPPFYVLLLGAH